MSVFVRNINGTSNRKPKGFNSWKDFWEHYKNEEFFICSNRRCLNLAEVGAHVQKVGSSSSKEWYIVPLCKSCNNSTDEFAVSRNDLVRVIVKK